MDFPVGVSLSCTSIWNPVRLFRVTITSQISKKEKGYWGIDRCESGGRPLGELRRGAGLGWTCLPCRRPQRQSELPVVFAVLAAVAAAADGRSQSPGSF
jgi:hypothetical protein